MAKIYKDLKVEESTYIRFKQIKNLFQFQNQEEYSVSDFLNILLDNLGKGVERQFQKLDRVMEKTKND